MATKDNLANSVQERSRIDSTSDQTTIKQMPGRAEITGLAQDRKRWRRLTPQIEEAAEESQGKNWAKSKKKSASQTLTIIEQSYEHFFHMMLLSTTCPSKTIEGYSVLLLLSLVTKNSHFTIKPASITVMVQRCAQN